jgi:predicted phage tail protein
VDILTAKVEALQTVTKESEKKQKKVMSELAEKVNECAQLQETVQEIKTKHIAEVAVLRKETTDKFSIMRDEINLIAMEKKVLGDTLTKKVEEAAKEVAVLKKEKAAQATENASKFLGLILYK